MGQPRDPNDILALRFRWLTPFYDAVVGTPTRERSFKQALIRQARLEPGHEVRDLACGAGTLTIWIKEQQPQADVVGVDGDSAILAIARRKAGYAGTPVRCVQALSYRLPYSAACFDRVVSSLFFHHLSWENKQRTARELYRVLKPGGELHADWGARQMR